MIMSEKLKSNEIHAANYNVVLDILLDRMTTPEFDPVRENLYMNLNGSFHVGEIMNYGTKATDKDWCPELKNAECKYAIVGDFDGFNPPTEDKYTKVVSSHSIVALIKKYKDMEIEDIIPTNTRVVVELINEKDAVNGFSIAEKTDPREGQVQTGKILKIAEGAAEVDSSLKVGMTVAFDPYCGNLLINTIENKIKTIQATDILYYITE